MNILLNTANNSFRTTSESNALATKFLTSTPTTSNPVLTPFKIPSIYFQHFFELVLVALFLMVWMIMILFVHALLPPLMAIHFHQPLTVHIPPFGSQITGTT